NAGTSCWVNGTGVTRVVFSMDATTLNTDTTMSDGMQCMIDTTKFSNGTHTLTATAYDASGNSRKDIISLNVQNTTVTPTPTPSSGLPANGARGVATFESIGLYWKPSSNPGSAGCPVTFRKVGDSAWRQGLDMWYDPANAECSGSLVQLEPNTSYEIQTG